ncbi:unnamed protein product [Paramecium sonneborni]|uniref:Transmembrane protein n=1 Tax=Paramecium sonneborni TaxID=65129 RepID=A0A8S1MHK5_9CILI|nr:unnamed protein product [Paramecium sonneborni]
MNKWFLVFHNIELEEQFQQGLKHEIRKQVFVGTLIGLVIIVGYDLFVQILSQDYYHLIFNIIFLGMAIILTFVIWNKQYLIKYALIIINLLIASVQFQLNPAVEQQYNYIFGQSIMASHVIIITTADFKQSIFQIIGLALIRTIIMYLKTSTVDLQMYCYIIIIMVFQIYVQYITDLAQRKQFLLNIKENYWEKFIPNLIRKPFYIFNFKDNIFKLTLKNDNLDFQKLANDLCDGCNLREILRHCKLNTISLENLIISNQSINTIGTLDTLKNNIQNYSFKILTLGTFQLTFSKFQTDKTEYIIILDNFESVSQNSSKQRSFLKNFIINQTKLFIQFPKNPKIIYAKLIVQNLNVLCLLKQHDKTIAEFDLVMMINKLSKIIGKTIIEMQVQRTAINIIGLKTSLLIYILQIFIIIKKLNPTQKVSVKITDQDIYIFLPFANLLTIIQQIRRNYLCNSLHNQLKLYTSENSLQIHLNEEFYQKQP